MHYDPKVGPRPADWLAASEDERWSAVRHYHEATEQPHEGSGGHAAIHTIVETQLAQGHPAATDALARLQRDGLDRHDAIHAIGSVVAKDIYNMLKHRTTHEPEGYARRLAALTANSWRRGSQ